MPGYSFTSENIDWGSGELLDSVKDSFDVWAESDEGHRDNILDPNVKYMGVACYTTEHDGKSYHFWAQIFYSDVFV